MTKLVETIAKSLVDHPERIVINEREDRQGSILQLQVAGDDMGKVIGKQGRIAKALRTVVKAAAVKQSKKIIVEIVSEDEE
ncbi:KH domain protein [Eubacterium nodatum ATCC 33099]|nr:KH domain protein [Eubacterium nodatum ATCC 33099]